MKKAAGIIVALICSAVMLAGFAACGGHDKAEANEYKVNNDKNIHENTLPFEREDDGVFVRTFTVIFITGDKSISVPAQTAEAGGRITEPQAEAEGKTLLGWYTADGEKWDFDAYTVTDNIMLTAWWQNE